MSSDKKSALDYLKEGYAKLPEEMRDETVIELKEAEVDSSTPLLKIIHGYQKLAKLEKEKE